MRTVLAIQVLCICMFAACSRANVECQRDANCDLASGGECTIATTGNHWCAYPDPSCSSGYRYSDQAIGDELSGVCVATGNDSGVAANIPDWVVRHGGPGDDRGTAIAAAPNGDIVVTGTFTGTMTLGGPAITAAGGTSVWVARYRADGTHLWSVRLGDTTFVGSSGISVDSNGDVYVTGLFLGPINFGGGVRTAKGGGFLVKISGVDGAYQWDDVFRAYPSGIAILNFQNIAICGIFSGTVDFGGGGRTSIPPNGNDNFLAVYNTTSGSHVWSKALTTTGDDLSQCGIAAVDGDVVVAGGFTGTASLGGDPLAARGVEDMYLARYRGADGAHLWSIREGSLGSVFLNVVTAYGSRVYVGGGFRGTINVGGSDLTAAGNDRNAFVASYNTADGAHVWSEQFAGTGDQETTSITANFTKLAVVVDFELGKITIGTSTFTADYTNVVIARLNPMTGAATAAAAQFPNPISWDTTMAISYTADRLAGVGTYRGSTSLLGTPLLSAGGDDIAMFRVDF